MGRAPETTVVLVWATDVVTVEAGVEFDGAADEELAPVLDCEPQGVIVVVLHDAVSKFLMRPHSLVSILSFQRALMATQSAK